MRGVVAKRLRKAARELTPPDAPERLLAELKGTRRQSTITLDKLDDQGLKQTVVILTATMVNHPQTLRGQYRMLKTVYREVRGYK